MLGGLLQALGVVAIAWTIALVSLFTLLSTLGRPNKTATRLILLGVNLVCVAWLSVGIRHREWTVGLWYWVPSGLVTLGTLIALVVYRRRPAPARTETRR